MVHAVLAGYTDKLDKNPEVYKEFLRVFRASIDYALKHPDEVFSAVGKDQGVDPAFFPLWFSTYIQLPVYLNKNDIQALDVLWREAKALGVLDVAPPSAESVIWDGAPFEEEIAQ